VQCQAAVRNSTGPGLQEEEEGTQLSRERQVHLARQMCRALGSGLSRSAPAAALAAAAATAAGRASVVVGTRACREAASGSSAASHQVVEGRGSCLVEEACLGGREVAGGRWTRELRSWRVEGKVVGRACRGLRGLLL